MRIVVGVDGSPAADRALRWAIAEGQLRGATVCAVYVWDLPPGFGAAGPLLGGSTFGSQGVEPEELQRSAEQRLAEAVGAVAGFAGVEQLVLQGHSAEVLVEQARSADLLVVGTRGHGELAGALLGSVSHACVQHASCPVVIVREPDARAKNWHPDEVIAREVARNKETWQALERLGVTAGSKLRLEFLYETGGEAGDRDLAEYLRRETDYDVEIEDGGVTGSTQPMRVDPKILDEWVAWMVLAGHDNGGCAFDGWTATVSAGHE
jgi:nucleotide-binding universal stress UspA family protein